jgi:hypothetical protein
MRQLLTTLSLCVCFVAAYSQASNDEIRNRIELTLDQSRLTSTTKNSKVEWSCINKKLTQKCLIYHNDQWFSIKPDREGALYINISNQLCSDRYGVQMVVIEGDPCKTETYRLKKCIAFTDQSNFFVKLDSLKSNIEYLINIDGYLGDQCQFDIEFSSDFKGIPAEAASSNSIALSKTQMDSIVHFHWAVHDSLTFLLQRFELYRKKSGDKKASKIALAAIYNAYGALQKEYTLSDTLHGDGDYQYRLYGRTKDDLMLLYSDMISFRKPSPKYFRRSVEYIVSNPGFTAFYIYAKGGSLNQPLFATKQNSLAGKNSVLLDFTEFVKKGTYQYKIVIKSKDKREEQFLEIMPEQQ